MARKAKEEYVVGILFPTKTQTTIKYVTSVQTEPKVAKWDDGKEAMMFSKDYAKDLAFGLCVNGYAAIVMIKPDYLTLANPKSEDEEFDDSPAWEDDSDRGCEDCPPEECTGHCMSCYYRPV